MKSCSIHLLLIANTLVNSTSSSENLPNIDKRRDALDSSFELAAERATAAGSLQQRIPGVRIDLDEILSSPKFIFNRYGFMSGPDITDEIRPKTSEVLAQPRILPDDPHRRIKQFLDENAALFGYDA